MKLTKILSRFFVEEHQEIYDKIVAGDLDGAVSTLALLDEMSKSADKRELKNHMKVLVKHIIKRVFQQQPNNRSWNTSIRNSIREITTLNERQPGSYHFSDDELINCLDVVYNYALEDAADEIKDIWGRHPTTVQLAAQTDRQAILGDVFLMILNARIKS